MLLHRDPNLLIPLLRRLRLRLLQLLLLLLRLLLPLLLLLFVSCPLQVKTIRVRARYTGCHAKCPQA